MYTVGPELWQDIQQETLKKAKNEKCILVGPGLWRET